MVIGIVRLSAKGFLPRLDRNLLGKNGLTEIT